MNIFDTCSYFSLSIPEKDFEVTNYQIDSRKVAPEGLFFAIKGARIDPHDKLEEVAQNGGKAAFVSKTYKGPSFGLFLLFVDDVTDVLQKLAKISLANQKIPQLLALTGSSGKTTTKEFISCLLGDVYRVGKNPGSANSQVGLPISILNMEKDKNLLILEMGISVSGEMANLVKMVLPDVAIITNLSIAHGGNFSNGIDDIAKEKGLIFSSPKTKKLIINSSCLSHYKNLTHRKGLEIKTFSTTDKTADFFLFQDQGQCYIIEKGNDPIAMDLPFSESHLVEDALCAIAVARDSGLSWEEISRRLPMLKTPPMRFEKIFIDDTLFIKDCYNASPDSVFQALNNFPAPKMEGRKIFIFGEMKELGSYADDTYNQIQSLALQNVDVLFTYGDDSQVVCQHFLQNDKPAMHFSDKKMLAKHLSSIIKKEDVVLVKGCSANNLNEIFTHLEKKSF